MSGDYNEEKLPTIFPVIINRTFVKCHTCSNELDVTKPPYYSRMNTDFVSILRKNGWRQRWAGRLENEKEEREMEEWRGIFVICSECAKSNTNVIVPRVHHHHEGPFGGA